MFSPFQFAQLSQRQKMMAGLSSLGVMPGEAMTPTRDGLDVRAAGGARVNMLALPSWQKGMTAETWSRQAIIPMRSDAPVNMRGAFAGLGAETALGLRQGSSFTTAASSVMNRGPGIPAAVSSQARPAQAIPANQQCPTEMYFDTGQGKCVASNQGLLDGGRMGDRDQEILAQYQGAQSGTGGADTSPAMWIAIGLAGIAAIGALTYFATR